jgi:hypothetical protein
VRGLDQRDRVALGDADAEAADRRAAETEHGDSSLVRPIAAAGRGFIAVIP